VRPILFVQKKPLKNFKNAKAKNFIFLIQFNTSHKQIFHLSRFISVYNYKRKLNEINGISAKMCKIKKKNQVA